MAELHPKVSIIGAGNVGMRYAYALILRGLARKLVIVDINKRKLEGDVMDLSHGAPYVSPVEIDAGNYPDIADSDLVVITAGRNQKPNQSRLDLTKSNVDLFSQMIPEIVKYAPRAVYLVVTNPVDVLSYATYKFTGKPAHEVLGSGTVLDSARFRYLLGNHCNVDPRNIHAYILGEHGDSEFAAWSTAIVGGVLFKNYCPLCRSAAKCDMEKDKQKIFHEVRDSAYKIIELKGETSYGIGLAMVRITAAILNNENSILPVSSYVNNYMGINDVYLSLPAVVGSRGIREVLPMVFDEKEKEELMHSAQTIKSFIEGSGLYSKKEEVLV